jgi:hypothetical protein
MLGLSAFVYKGYCRYVCPLGAGLAVLGRVRLLNWLPRRAAPNAANRARPAATDASTRPSNPKARSTTKNASSAWTAW